MFRTKWVCSCAVGILSVGLALAHARGETTDAPPTNTVAQSAATPAGGPAACRCIGEGGSSTIDQIRAALDSPMKSTGIEFSATPLEQVIASLQEEYGIPILLDQPALHDDGLGADTPITVNLHHISLKSALRLMLRQRGLTFIIEDDVLVFTTPEQAENHLVTCVYDVRDLLNGADDAEGVESLIQAITSCVATETWAANGGGQAQIQPLKPGVLVISQSQQVQEDIRNLLDALRQVR